MKDMIAENETLQSLINKTLDNLDPNNYDFTSTLAELLAEDRINQFHDLIKFLEGIRYGLDESNISQELKVQIILDIIEVIFAVYNGKTRDEIKDQIFEIFKPTDYYQILSHKVKMKLKEMENHSKTSVETIN